MCRPADTVLTRMYNQNTVKDPITGRVKGALYTNPIDCLWKTFKAEGIAGWYKGECRATCLVASHPTHRPTWRGHPHPRPQRMGSCKHSLCIAGWSG
jgi:hypothetical protein